MGFIPSNSLEPVLQSVQAGVWVDPLPEGRVALVSKMPDSIIKAIFRGCRCTLVLGVIEVDGKSVLCPGLRVEDEPQHPITIAGPPWTSAEYIPLIMRVLTTGTPALHLVNELAHPVLSAAAVLEPTAAAQALADVTAANLFLLTPSDETLSSIADLARLIEGAMNRFQARLYRSASSQQSDPGRLVFIDMTLDLQKPIEIFEVTEINEGGPFRIDDEDEGKKLERELHLALGRLYPGRTHLSPTVRLGATTRELTDVLAFDDMFYCLLEAKTPSVLTTTLGQPASRRTATVRKHVEQAIGQLKGALRNLRSDVAIQDAEGKEIRLPNRDVAPAHAVVLLAHMYYFVDWRAVANDILTSSESEQHKALFHVMDLQEFMYLANHSRNAEQFGGYLMQRWLHVRRTGTVYGRAKMRSELPPTDD
jgi:hypothetical protein